MNKPVTSPARYERQLILPQVGEEGQNKLFNAKILVVGTGGLGSPILYYLAAAGIGTLGLVDSDVVDVSNLQRQILHWEKDLNRPKPISAQEKLSSFNSQVEYKTYPMRLDETSAKELFPQYDLIVAAVDNMETRDLINKVCFAQGKTWIEGGVNQFTGLVTVFQPPEGPCYRCLYPQIPPKSNKPIGLLGTMPGVIGVLQAHEVLKIILGIGKPLIGRLLIYDALETRFDTVAIKSMPNCPVCGKIHV